MINSYIDSLWCQTLKTAGNMGIIINLVFFPGYILHNEGVNFISALPDIQFAGIDIKVW
jgi:hypothetical protein